MKALLILLTSLFSFSLSAQIFVKSDAMGDGSGTSWENAYTDLYDALNNNPDSEIWVASGTYTPVNAPEEYFFINSVVSLYGGFAGTESNLSERNIESNPTILSGDINQDDTPNDSSMNREDNTLHVLVAVDNDSISLPTIIDGFTFSGGHTNNDPDMPIEERAGGGIFSYSTMQVSNCTFSNNFARTGASVYLSSEGEEGDNSSFDNCTFSNNSTSSQSAGLFMLEVDNVSVTNCSFTDNNVVRGAMYPRFCDNLTVENCLFQNNIGTADGFGGAIFSWSNTGTLFSNCTFDSNVVGNGSAVYNDGRFIDISADNTVFNNCDFTNNEAQDWGGSAIYSWQGGFTFNNCTIVGNIGSNVGAIYFNAAEKEEVEADHVRLLNSNFTGNASNGFGGGAIYAFSASFTTDNCTFDTNIAVNGANIYADGPNKEVIVKNSSFADGAGDFGVAQACYGENSDFYLTNNTYTECEANDSGGALTIGFLAKVFVDSCNFINNTAESGGAVYIQNELTEAYFSNCKFDTNIGIDVGGAINANTGAKLTVDACEFKANSANRGGGIYFAELDQSTQPSELLLTNSVFEENSSNLQGGGLSLLNVDATLQSNLFYNNFSANGAGGAIAYVVSNDATATMSMINNTLADNSAAAGTELYASTGTDAALTLNTQNNIFSNTQGSNYFVEGETMPLIVSNGGNISDDASTSTIFTNMLDQNEVGTLNFINTANTNYQLNDSSIARDAGVSDGAPTTDILGNPRIGEVDSGAYEWQELVTTETIIEDENALTIFPNPVKNQLSYQLNDAIQGKLFVTIYDMTGKALMTQTLEKNTPMFADMIDVKTLQSGMYDIFISNGQQATVRRFVKM